MRTIQRELRVNGILFSNKFATEANDFAYCSGDYSRFGGRAIIRFCVNERDGLTSTTGSVTTSRIIVTRRISNGKSRTASAMERIDGTLERLKIIAKLLYDACIETIR